MTDRPPLSPLHRWECPGCGAENSDPTYYNTHCGACGLVVLTGSEGRHFMDVWSEGWYVSMQGEPITSLTPPRHTSERTDV